jgi:uncharacterized membrane protein
MALNEKEQFDIARELIRHEDGLVNNRITWLLVLQGFLFTAFVNGISLFDKFSDRPNTVTCITVGLILICVLGMVSSLTALNVVQIAFKQAEEVKVWWGKTGLKEKFPPVAGKLGKGWYYFLFSTGRMPFVFVGVWSILIVLLLAGLW